jgi:hypothetical protein
LLRRLCFLCSAVGYCWAMPCLQAGVAQSTYVHMLAKCCALSKLTSAFPSLGGGVLSRLLLLMMRDC